MLAPPVSPKDEPPRTRPFVRNVAGDLSAEATCGQTVFPMDAERLSMPVQLRRLPHEHLRGICHALAMFREAGFDDVNDVTRMHNVVASKLSVDVADLWRPPTLLEHAPLDCQPAESLSELKALLSSVEQQAASLDELLDDVSHDRQVNEMSSLFAHLFEVQPATAVAEALEEASAVCPMDSALGGDLATLAEVRVVELEEELRQAKDRISQLEAELARFGVDTDRV